MAQFWKTRYLEVVDVVGSSPIKSTIESKGLDPTVSEEGCLETQCGPHCGNIGKGIICSLRIMVVRLTLNQYGEGSSPLVSTKYGGGIAPAGNLVLKTSGTRDGMGIDTSLRRQIYLKSLLWIFEYVILVNIVTRQMKSQAFGSGFVRLILEPRS